MPPAVFLLAARWRVWRARHRDLMRAIVALSAVVAFWSAGHDCTAPPADTTTAARDVAGLSPPPQRSAP